MTDEAFNHRRGPWRATFQPTRTDNVRPAMTALIGQEVIVDYLWHQEDGQSYPGQPVFLRRGGNPPYWIPFEDLAGMTEIPEEEAL